MTITDAARDSQGRVIPAGCKSAKLNLGDAWRTTCTHIIAGDVVRVQGDGDGDGDGITASPGNAPKRSMWVKVADVIRSPGQVQIVLAKDWGTLITVAHTAITRQERPEELAARIAEAGQERRDSVASTLAAIGHRESAYAADHDTRMLLASRAQAIGYTGDGAMELAERAFYVQAYPAPCGDECETHPAMRPVDGQCEACEVERQFWAAAREAAAPVGLPTSDETWAVSLAAAGDAFPGCGCGTLRCHGDGPCATPGTVVNTAARGRLVGYMCQGCQDRLDAVLPPTPPATEPQRRAIRLLAWAATEGTTSRLHAATLKTLIRDGWVADRTLRLTADALAWLASEHTAEVQTLVVDGVTLFGATCNCGMAQENPRLKRVPWSSASCVTAEDAVAVALGHGTVSRPLYGAAAPLAVGDRVEVLGDWTEDGQPLPGTVTLLDGASAVWVEHAEGCAPLAYGAEQLRRVPVGETLAAEEAALDLPTAECRGCKREVTFVHGMWLVADDGDELCEGNPGGFHDADNPECVAEGHDVTLAHEAAAGIWHGSCDRCDLRIDAPSREELLEAFATSGKVKPEISVTDARITAVACEECGIMPHDVDCPTGLRLDTVTVEPITFLPVEKAVETLRRIGDSPAWVARRGRRKASLNGRKR